MDNIMLAVTLLITGFVVVFLVLFLLIGIIKLYGTLIYNAHNRKKEKEAQKTKEMQLEKEAQANSAPKALAAMPASDEIPGEIVAVIAAAVDAMYGKNTVAVKSIKRLPQTRPVWSTAGLMDNTRPF